jgi:hypothetical protein
MPAGILVTVQDLDVIEAHMPQAGDYLSRVFTTIRGDQLG